MYTIIKSIAIFVTAALALNAIAPALAHAAKHLQGEQVNANALVRDAYIAVIYRDNNNRERSARGWIDAIDETSFTIRSGGLKSETTIAYAKVLSIVMSTESTVPAKQMNEVNRLYKKKQMRAANATVMTRGQIVPEKIEKGWYAHAIYTSQGAKETATGWIVSKDASSIAIKKQNRERWRIAIKKQNRERWKIAYSDIDTLVVAKDRRDIEEWKNLRQAVQLFSSGNPKLDPRFNLQNAKVRFKAPSLTKKRIVRKKRIVGEVVKMIRDTLFIREGSTFLEVPMSSISNLEVSLGQRRNTGKGLVIGLGISAGLALMALVGSSQSGDPNSGSLWAASNEAKGALSLYYLGIPLTAATTLIGAAIKSDKWVAVPPQRLNLSIAPTSAKGLRAALTFNF